MNERDEAIEKLRSEFDAERDSRMRDVEKLSHVSRRGAIGSLAAFVAACLGSRGVGKEATLDEHAKSEEYDDDYDDDIS